MARIWSSGIPRETLKLCRQPEHTCPEEDSRNLEAFLRRPTKASLGNLLAGTFFYGLRLYSPAAELVLVVFLCRSVEEGPARGLEPPAPTFVAEAGAGISVCITGLTLCQRVRSGSGRLFVVCYAADCCRLIPATSRRELTTRPRPQRHLLESPTYGPRGRNSPRQI